MQIPGYRRLEVGEMIMPGDWANHKAHDTSVGMVLAFTLGTKIETADACHYYRPLPPIDSERTDTADIDKLCAFLLMTFTDDVTITEKSADIAIRLLTRLKAVQEAIK